MTPLTLVKALIEKWEQRSKGRAELEEAAIRKSAIRTMNNCEGALVECKEILADLDALSKTLEEQE
jgi:hypothetical protein